MNLETTIKRSKEGRPRALEPYYARGRLHRKGMIAPSHKLLDGMIWAFFAPFNRRF